jgi:hypothetical protein
MLRIELGLVVLAVIVAFIRPQLGSRWFEKIERRFAALARRRTLSVVIVGLLALALRAVLLPIEPIPEPLIHDEFGYLLAADTFAHGRITNPPHPMWVHFETFHAMFHPTYASVYPPAQGLVLAAGKLIAGHEFWGVWVSLGAMCSAICWMLQGWISPPWALLGGILAALRYGAFGYWANSYWGGSVAAIGGAIVLGALPRIKSSQPMRHSISMGLGLAILANSRPYEGAVLSIPIAIILIVWLFKKDASLRPILLKRVFVPLSVILALGAAGTGYYFRRVTGNAFLMPYQVERHTYAVAPYMVWQHLYPEPTYHHAVIRKMYVGDELKGYAFFRSPLGLLGRMDLAWSFFLGPALTLPLLTLALTLPPGFSLLRIQPSTAMLLALLAVSAAGSLLINFYSAHYSAPATALVIAAVVMAARELRNWNAGGLALVRSIPIICVLSLVLRAFAAPLHIPLGEFFQYSWYQKGPESVGRAAIQTQLEHLPGSHLVIVRYEPNHEPFREWVYNDADIDGAKIVWARDMGNQNSELIRYFKDRRVWRLDADEPRPKPVQYLNH